MSQCDSLEALNFSNGQFYRWLTTVREKGTLMQYAFDYIDVRDMAEAFVAALQVEEAGNERFIVDAGQYFLGPLALLLTAAQRLPIIRRSNLSESMYVLR